MGGSAMYFWNFPLNFKQPPCCFRGPYCFGGLCCPLASCVQNTLEATEKQFHYRAADGTTVAQFFPSPLVQMFKCLHIYIHLGSDTPPRMSGGHTSQTRLSTPHNVQPQKEAAPFECARVRHCAVQGNTSKGTQILNLQVST